MTKGYTQIEEGRGNWYEPSHTRFISQCCSCALVHVYQFAVVDRKTREPIKGAQVQFKIKVDRRKTAASRRKLKFSKDE